MDSYEVPRPNPSIISRVVDDGVVLVSPQAGKVRVLNSVGTAIWELMDGERSLAEIKTALSSRFDVPAEQLAEDLSTFLSDLLEKGLIETV